MKLYHFAALSHLPSILREGLSKGEETGTSTRSENAAILTSKRWQAALDPTGQGIWFLYWGVVPPAWLTVEVRDGDGYAPPPDLDLLVRSIDAEREKFVAVACPISGGSFASLHPGVESSWLLDGELQPA